MNLPRPHPAILYGVWYAVVLHVLWSFLLIFDGNSKNVTGMHVLSLIWPARAGLAIVLLVVAAMATTGLIVLYFERDAKHRLACIALLAPQQVVLGISAFGALHAMWLASYADGVQRPVSFLIADQTPQILALLMHSATILYLWLAVGRESWK